MYTLIARLADHDVHDDDAQDGEDNDDEDEHEDVLLNVGIAF